MRYHKSKQLVSCDLFYYNGVTCFSRDMWLFYIDVVRFMG